MGISLHLSQKQWVDLGDLSSYSCFPKLATCGPNGTSLTAWINIINCPNDHGFLTSYNSRTTGLRLFCPDSGVKLVISLCTNIILLSEFCYA